MTQASNTSSAKKPIPEFSSYEADAEFWVELAQRWVVERLDAITRANLEV